MKIKFIITISLLFLLPLFSYSQNIEQLKKANSDCPGAIFLKDTLFGPTSAPEDYGKAMEISGKKTSLYAFHREHHTVWYEFVAPANCTFTFLIEPLSVDDDYDFLLFRKDEKNICRKIREKSVKPVRSNISRNNTNIESITGLSLDAEKKYVNRGPGDDFSQALKVNKGDTLLMVLDNVYEGGEGHILKLQYHNCTKPEKKKKEPEISTPSPKLSVSTLDKDTDKPVNADIKVVMAHNEKEIISQTSVSHLIGKLQPDNEYKLTVRADSFFRAIRTIETPAHDTTISLTVELTKIEKDKKLTLNNLYFHPSSASFLHKSYETLQNLLKVMQEHPTLKIAIHGHVNQPHQWKNRSSPEFLQRLSDRRAKSVKRYLKRRGIEEERMLTKGFSNKEMIYPRADTKEKMRANRRVEIIVLDI